MGATVRDQLVDIVTDTLGCAAAKVVDDATVASLGADSIDMIELLVRTEDDCAVTITDDEAAGLTTFGDLVALVERKRGAA